MPVPLPSAFYSPTNGFGAGVGWNLRHAVIPDDHGRLRIRAQQYRQSIELDWASARPGGTESGVVVSLFGFRNLRERYYGLGPSAARSEELILKRNEMRSEIRGRFVSETGLWIQPRALFRIGKLASFQPARGAPDGGDAITHLNKLTASGRLAGFDLGMDTGWTSKSGASVQFHLTRRSYGSSIGQTVGGFLLQQSIEFTPARRLAFRASLDRTLWRTEFLPYFLQPRLDDRLAPGWDRFRFYGNDRLVLGATYLWPLVSILRSHVIQGVAALTVSQVYDDLFEQFSPSIALAPNRENFDGNVPLEPTFGLGWQLLSLRDGNTPIQVTLGFSAEGFVTTAFRVRQDLSHWYSAIR